MEEDPSECSEYSQHTIDVGNEVFLHCEEHEADTPELMEKFEYLREKKYSYGMDRYAHYLIAPEILQNTSREKRVDQVKKSLEMMMKIFLRPSAARGQDFDAYLFRISPKLYHYKGNSRNRNSLKKWSYPKRDDTMPRILSKLIDSEAKAFLKKWEPLNFQWCNFKTWQDWQKFYAHEL